MVLIFSDLKIEIILPASLKTTPFDLTSFSWTDVRVVFSQVFWVILESWETEILKRQKLGKIARASFREGSHIVNWTNQSEGIKKFSQFSNVFENENSKFKSKSVRVALKKKATKIWFWLMIRYCHESWFSSLKQNRRQQVFLIMW